MNQANRSVSLGGTVQYGIKDNESARLEKSAGHPLRGRVVQSMDHTKKAENIFFECFIFNRASDFDWAGRLLYVLHFHVRPALSRSKHSTSRTSDWLYY